MKDMAFEDWLKSLTPAQLENIFNKERMDLARAVWNAAREAAGWEAPRW